MRQILAFVAFSTVCCAWGQASGAIREDISGMYSFLRDGESIQLNLQDGKLSGWVTTYGFLDSDKETLVDRFFQKASLQGDRVYFITKPLHGCWLEFSGRVERGEAATRAKEGYFRLTGNLTEYTTDADNKVSTKRRDVTFKLSSDGSDVRPNQWRPGRFQGHSTNLVTFPVRLRLRMGARSTCACRRFS